MHIIGQSRVDTWQKHPSAARPPKNVVMHHPIQVEGRSRVDTWQTTPLRRRARSATDVSRSSVTKIVLTVFI